MRKFVTSMVPASTDSMNAHNHLSEIQFNLRKAGTPNSEIAKKSRIILKQDLQMDKIPGAFPEKLPTIANNVRS